jgi:UDP-N-acetylglucosamine transferase subunit ALG13
MININMDHLPGQKLRILVAPLDWGLGHATRCIPVIYELIRQEAEVWIGASGAQEELLRREFPYLPFLGLKGYGVTFSRSRKGLWKRLFLQLPRLLKTVKMEHKWLAEKVAAHGFHAIISDNRFGLHHASIPSILITHQLRLKSPLGKWTEDFFQRKNYQYINRFTACWIPDAPGEDNLAGELSHPQKKPAIPIHYTGLLSRLKKTGLPMIPHRIFVSLSGPEPQRSLLENKLVEQISHYGGTAVIVRGLPAEANIIPSSNDIRFFNHLSTEEFNREMEQASVIISRSGYSTVMDMVRLGKKAIMIPTPGQAEQEYLADYLAAKKWIVVQRQEDFHLNTALAAAALLQPLVPPNDSGELTNVIGAFLQALKEKRS